MKHLKFTSKITALFLTMVLLLSLAAGVAALSPGDPCLLYGNDPDKGDMYETYGNEVFFMQNRELKTPGKSFVITLNRESTKNIFETSKREDSLAKIINESYFPELEGFKIVCSGLNPDYFPDSISYFLNDDNARLQIQIYLDDWSRENYKKCIEALAPRADVDIESIHYVSYSLNDITLALKYIARWSDYIYPNLSENDIANLRKMDYDSDEDITMIDVTHILQILAGWDVYMY